MFEILKFRKKNINIKKIFIQKLRIDKRKSHQKLTTFQLLKLLICLEEIGEKEIGRSYQGKNLKQRII